MMDKYFISLSLVVMTVFFQSCSHYSPLLTEDDLEWVKGFERHPDIVLESEGGETLRFHFEPPDVNNTFLQIHLNEGKGCTSQPGNAGVRFTCFSDSKNGSTSGWIRFRADSESNYPTADFHIDNLFCADKPPLLIATKMVIEDKQVDDCYAFTVGVNLENAYNRQSKIRQVVISKQYGIIYVAFVDGTEFCSRELFNPMTKCIPKDNQE